jgi:hypothetical protein
MNSNDKLIDYLDIAEKLSQPDFKIISKYLFPTNFTFLQGLNREELKQQTLFEDNPFFNESSISFLDNYNNKLDNIRELYFPPLRLMINNPKKIPRIITSNNMFLTLESIEIYDSRNIQRAFCSIQDNKVYAREFTREFFESRGFEFSSLDRPYT